MAPFPLPLRTTEVPAHVRTLTTWDAASKCYVTVVRA